MTTEHTPGPWFVFHAGPDGPYEVMRAMHGVNIATDIQSGADADLIAAAPELLGAARKALNHIENTECEFGIELDSGNALRAAIAKATQS